MPKDRTVSSGEHGRVANSGGGGGSKHDHNHQYHLQNHHRLAQLTELNGALMADAVDVGRIKAIVRKCPEQARVESQRILPLHLACNSRQPDTEAIELLIDACPEAVTRQDAAGFTPLHYACQNAAGVSVRAIRSLINANPACVRQKNRAGWLPLFLACGRPDTSVSVVELLVERYPAALREPFGTAGLLALHWACSQHAPLPVVEVMFRGYPGAVRTVTKSGMLPVHWACACGAELPVIIFLTFQYPESLLEGDESGLVPLHLACHKQDSLPVVQWLVARAPASVRVRACNGHLPLDSCRASQARAGKSVQNFVRYATERLDPAVLSSRDVLQRVIDGYRDAYSAPWNVVGRNGSKRSRQEARQHVQFLEPLVDLVPVSAPPAVNLDCEKVKLVVGKVENGRGFQPIEVSSEYVDSLRAAAGACPSSPNGRSTAGGDEDATDACTASASGGNGLFGKIVLGRDAESGQWFYIRAMWSARRLLRPDVVSGTDHAKEAFCAEIANILKLVHPNIAPLYAYHMTETVGPLMVFAHPTKGPLAHFWSSYFHRQRLSFPRRVRIALQVLTALQFLHAGGDGSSCSRQVSRCYHRELSSHNVYLRLDMTAVLMDVGLSRLLLEDDDDVGGVVTRTALAGRPATTAYYRCPAYESGKLEGYQAACDIFSLGVVMAEIWTGKLMQGEARWSSADPVSAESSFQDLLSEVDDCIDPRSGRWGSTSATAAEAGLPPYMVGFARAAEDCMRGNPDERPTGAALLEKLRAVHVAACRDDEASNGGGSSPRQRSSFLNGNDSCDCDVGAADDLATPEKRVCGWCKTADSDCVPRDGRSVCLNCLALTAADGLVDCPVRRLLEPAVATAKATLVRIQVTLGHLESRGALHCPRLFILAPPEVSRSNTATEGPGDPAATPHDWLGSQEYRLLHLYFLCAHSLELVEPPLRIRVNGVWINRVLPALAVSLQLLQAADMALRGSSRTFTAQAVRALWLAVRDRVEDEGVALLLSRCASEGLTVADVERLNQSAYCYIEEKAFDQNAWQATVRRFSGTYTTATASANGQQPERQTTTGTLWVKRRYVAAGQGT